MASKLEQAAEIFIKLGWEEANLSETPHLSIGTKEDQKIAKEGLKSGEWGEFRQISKRGYAYVPLVEVDFEKLSLFAIRIGVDAKRAAAILRKSSKEAFEIIFARGEKYAKDFVTSAYRSSRRSFEHSATIFADLCVHLVHEFQLQIPEDIEYIKDWAVIAGRAMGLEVEYKADKELIFHQDLDYIKDRFQEHIKMGVSLNAPATGPFSKVIVKGVEKGLISRDFAMEQIFFALDASIRPGDRKEWVKSLETLEIREEEILAREQNLIPLLSMGDSFLIETFAPVLIHGASEELIPSIMIASFSTKVKKTLQMILKSAANRKKPEHIDELQEWIYELMKSEDKKISASAMFLAKKWEMKIQEHSQEEKESVSGLWVETPTLWKIPKFKLSPFCHMTKEDLLEIYNDSENKKDHQDILQKYDLKDGDQIDSVAFSLTALSKVIAEIATRKVTVYDLWEEELLALTNLIARIDQKEAKLHFAGMKISGITLTYQLGQWVKNKVEEIQMDGYQYSQPYDDDAKPTKKTYTSLLTARNAVVIKNMGMLPCILSTPSFEDLSISFSDLKNRILKYQHEGFAYVFEPDLQLALARLDVKSATKRDIEALKEVKLLITLPNGRNLYEGNDVYELDEVDRQSDLEEEKRGLFVQKLNEKRAKSHKLLSVADVVLKYLEDPFQEPKDYYSKGTKYWGFDIDMELPASLKDFPDRFGYASDQFHSIFPLFGDFSLFALRRDTEVYHGQGLMTKQIVKRRTPLPKGASINLLGLGSYLSEENAQDVVEAIHEAWERGLLLPKVADVNLLDWDNEPPSNLASFTKSLDDRAQGGMLSVVWPVIHDMISLSLQQQRMISGTAELVKLAKKYLPEVLYAIKKNIALEDELKMDAISTLSKKSGSSLAVTTAKEIMQMLSKEYDLQDVSMTKKDQKEKKVQKTLDKTKKDQKGKKEELFEIRTPETSFDLFWKYYPKENPILEDGVQMNVTLFQIMTSKKGFVFDLILPEVPDKLYKVMLYDWIYSLESEGQIAAIECPIEVKKYENDPEKQLELLRNKEHQVWLYYDAKKKNICVSKFRNTQKGNGPLQRAAYPLSSTLKTISLALIAQDGESIYSALRLVREFVKTGEIGVDMTKKAMEELLKHEDVSPAKLIRVLEQENELFSALWPILTSSVQKAGRITKETKKIPTWANRILDNCLYNAYYLKEAMRKGHIPKEDAKWKGLKEIAGSKAKSTAIVKAKSLLKYFELN